MLDETAKHQDSRQPEIASASASGAAAAGTRTSEAPNRQSDKASNIADTAPLASAAEPAAKPRKAWRKKLLLSLALLAAIAGGGYFGHYYWTEGRFLVSTDDAYLGADMSILSPKVTGYVETVAVQENDIVREGQPLVVIDDGDFRLALETAEAKIATERAAIERIASQRAAAEAEIGEAEATKRAAEVDLAKAELDLSRASELVSTGAGTKAQRDAAQSARDSAAAKVTGAEATIETARANVDVLSAQGKESERTVRELEIARDQAARDLTFTTLKAPYDGIVGNLSVQPGDYVSAGRRLAAIVPLSKVYIDANFKETQLAEIVPGQKVGIEIDAMPGKRLEGTVVSLSPASGSVFSLLPSDNATGNFTKVVQRVPVRIAIDDAADFAGRLRPGLSAVVSVDIRTGNGETRSAKGAAAPKTADATPAN